jgi:ribonucleoside-diphosphate reductase alpha chain
MLWGKENNYFDSEEDSKAFYDETCFMLARQMAAPNSPQWFNTGLYAVYGIDGPAQGHCYFDPATATVASRTAHITAPTPRFIILSRGRSGQRGGIMTSVTRERGSSNKDRGTVDFPNFGRSTEKLSGRRILRLITS